MIDVELGRGRGHLSVVETAADHGRILVAVVLEPFVGAIPARDLLSVLEDPRG